MKSKNIFKKIGFFFFGVLAWYIISLISDWNGNAQAFKDGFNDATKNNIELIK